MNSFIELKKVTKTYTTGNKKFNALDGINLKINQGELVVILGPSGAGKSTLLNLLGGMDRATTGTVLIGDNDISKLSDDDLTKYRASDVGFIFQFYNIMPTLTVIKNVGISNQANKFPNELSGGEQQRVSIARAIMKNPKLLLCDEPTGALDSKTGIEVLKLLRKQCDEDTTVIIVTHNSLIPEIADRVIHIKNGKVGKVEENKKPKNI